MGLFCMCITLVDKRFTTYTIYNMRKIKSKEKDIARGWALGVLTQAEAAKKLKVTPDNAYSLLARALKELYREL